jgi:SP family general alpha glucoside:H+ symporter-like MFS transporter
LESLFFSIYHTMDSRDNATYDEATRQEMHEKDVAKITESDIVQDAQQATNKEHRLTFMTGMKAYKKAILWSILLSSAVIMEGYDTILVR